MRYSCISDCDGFEVRASDGAVILAKKLDAETEDQHMLTVLATDSGIPQLSSTTTVIIEGKLHMFSSTHLSEPINPKAGHVWRFPIHEVWNVRTCILITAPKRVLTIGKERGCSSSCLAASLQ